MRCRKAWTLGYRAFKFNYIVNVMKRDIAYFKKREKLPVGYGFGLDERVVEYPWILSRLKDEARIIMDAGSSLNHREILFLDIWEKRKLYITTLFDECRYKTRFPLFYIYEDLRHLSFEDNYFDSIICISTLEHVGMDNSMFYTPDQSKKENNKFAYLEAVKQLKRVLKPGSSIYWTMPYGQYENHGWFQVFDQSMVEALKKTFAPAQVYEEYFKYENNQWNFSTAEACRDAQYFDIHEESVREKETPAASESIVCLECIK